jgi:uncharacterized protein YqeY
LRNMTDKADLQNALKDAMRANDDLRKRTLRMALSAIRLAEVDKRRQLDEQETLAILQKEVKTRQEAIDEARGANRPQLEADAQAEIEVLQEFLPQPLTQEELEAMARQAVDEVGATSQREMGQVMKVLVPRLQGKATGKQASEVVRKLLE